MLIGTDQFRCPRCGETKPKTAEHFYFDRYGRVTGYCRRCQSATNRDYVLSDAQRHHRRLHQRAYLRRKHGVTPDRYRVVTSPYDNLPYTWRVCASPDCAEAFPTQNPRKVYCSRNCSSRVGYYRRLGRPFPGQTAPGQPAHAVPREPPPPRVCADERCRTLYVPVQGHQRFCCRACGDRYRVRAWYHRHRAQEGAA